MIVLKRLGIGLGVGCLVLGCFPSLSGVSIPKLTPVPEALGQMLPITAQANINGQRIQLEVTKTPQQQALGLMYRTELPDNRGMLFAFDPPRVVGFWMKNCKIPLDMIFLRNGVVRGIQVNAPPCITEPCPTYGTDELIDQVIEVRGGWTQKFGLQIGDTIQIENLP
ncbi:MAG: DUF192 domain-containing protein [Microcoleaceae cyanobacterium]